MEAAKALLMIFHRPPVITWSKGCKELVTQDSGNRIPREQSRAKSLTTRTVTCLVHGIGDFIGLYLFHAQLTYHPQPWKLVWVEFWWGFWPCPAIAKGNIPVIQPLRGAFALAFTGVFRKHIREVGGKGRQD